MAVGGASSGFCFGIVVFPGSNCEQDVAGALAWLGYRYRYVWHQSGDLEGCDALILPGGFSYGDYLRAGAIARFSPVMEAVRTWVAAGGPVLGICNGFQILTEAGLLPGALRHNLNLKFLCRPVSLLVEKSVCQWLDLPVGTVLTLPINHFSGNYYCDDLMLGRLEAKGQVVLRYCQPDGSEARQASAPNGSVDGIAGITNERGNVFGLMPHPERGVEGITVGSGLGTDGRYFFSAIVKRMAGRA
ncbi:MAG: phosphoribosylformylglycinamidine synthase subunit PurQ [Actinomycetia bacterium]|nr:phosphoribosylformylglycinamidine synthase subunit PurQ [Actinomycetes bacterium]